MNLNLSAVADPASAFLNMVSAIAGMITELADGQTAEQKQQLWQWFITDVTRWRKHFKLDE